MSETYQGKVRYGVIVLDEGTPPLPEGMRVGIRAVEANGHPHAPGTLLALMDQLDQMPADPDWPTDAAAPHDHDLYGSPRRP